MGIWFLILGLIHAPWPQADFHNVRHQDEPGQVCEHHDHLLRWHPDAGQAEDVAVLHWHWFLPTSNPVEPGQAGDGPSIRAHASDWEAPSPDSGPLIVPDRSSRTLDILSPGLVALGNAPFVHPADGPDLTSGPGFARTFGATFAPGISTASRLQRWSC